MRRIAIVALLVASLGAQAQVSAPYARRVRRVAFAGLGAPLASSIYYCTDCNAAAPCTSGGAGAFAFRVGSAWNCNIGSPGSAGANAALSNLASVAINASLIPGTDEAINLGSTTKRWGALYFSGGALHWYVGAHDNTIGWSDGVGPAFGDGVAPATATFNLQSLTAGRTYTWPNVASSIPVIPQTITVTGPTAARTWTVPDAAFSLARIDAAQTLAGTQTFSGSILGSGTVNRIGAATTNNANADTMMSASATTTTPLEIQTKAAPTADWFRVTNSASTRGLFVQSDGGVIIDQATGATYVSPFEVKYQGTSLFTVGGTNVTNVKGNRLINATGLSAMEINGDMSGRHYLGTGNTPSVAGSCGTSPSITGKDSFLKITTGTVAPTSCTVTFSVAFATAPVCTANAQTTTTPLNIATTTTTVIVSSAALTAGEVLYVSCGGF